MEIKASLQNHETNELKLKGTIADLKEKSKKHEEEIEHINNPKYDQLAVIETNLNRQLEKIGETLRTSLSEEVKRNIKEFSASG